MVTPAQEIPQDVKYSSISPSGKFTALLRQSDGDSKKRFVEVWADEMLFASIEVTDVHDEFYTDDFLGTIAFSPSEMSLIYLAEAKAPKANAAGFARFRYTPSLGEALVNRFRPTIYLFRWQSNSPSVVPLAPHSDGPSRSPYFFSQPSFLDDDTLVAIGHELTPQGHLLSVRWCHNRPTSIWKLALEKSSEESIAVILQVQLSDPARASRSPRVWKDIDGITTVFWLDHERGGPHASCSRLMSADSFGEDKQILVPYVFEPEPKAFPGLFTGWSLLSRPFLRVGNSVYIVCTSTVGARSSIMLVDVQKHEQAPRELTPEDDKLWSYYVLATDGQCHIVCSRSSLRCPPQLVVGQVNAYDQPVSWKVIWQPLLPPHVRSALNGLKLAVLPVAYPVETIILRSTADAVTDEVRPLLSIVHGGPHGASSTAFVAQTIAFALQGFTIQMPNYTGSIGYGAKHVEALVGKCGSRDVKDILSSVKAVVDNGMAVYGKGKHLYWGGSHGGFLGAHLVGQHPDLFTAVVLPNPVITPLPAESDIPDWYFEEFCRDNVPSGLRREQIPPDLYEKLYMMSPISYVGNVITPVMLFLGLADHRVSNTHGMTFYHALKAEGKAKVDLLTFPGQGHAIDGVEEARAAYEAALDWFEKTHS